MKKKGDMTSAEYRHYLKTGKEPDNRAPVCAPNRKPVRPSNEAGAMGDEKDSSRFSCIDVQDIHGAYCCSSCHDVIDGRTNSRTYTANEIALMHLEGVIRTQLRMVDLGLIE